MDKPIEVGADWSLLNESREELRRVVEDLRTRKYETTQEAMVAGEIREAFNHADESIFNVLNIASAQDDPKAKEALSSSFAAGLTATRAVTADQEQEQTTSN